ncbi:hypothetical protein [Archangium sp.]|uniref:hypothetical protein n=1 Tax=Archangium sp. TaxID=1872627 RepID=UPI002D27F10A|nr:hypothetical protein [Archangium sp.]HYO57226.1 hypothetical protein [Archangium sp.]
MASNMSCIGITARDQEDFGRRMSLLLERSEPAGKSGAHELRVWSDASGASVSFVLSKDGVECATPGFRAGSRLHARAKRFASDPDCRFCDPLLVDIVDAKGELFYPLATQLDDLLLTRERVNEGAVLELGLCAFAHGLDVWADAATFEAAQEGKEVKFTTESLMPSGLFPLDGTERPPAAEAFITGRVLEAGLRENLATGETFQHAIVQTYGGSYDVLASPQELAAPLEPGNIIQGDFWLVGRVTSGLAEAPRPGLLRRLFRS